MNNCIDFLDKLLHSQCGKVVIKKKKPKKTQNYANRGLPRWLSGKGFASQAGDINSISRSGKSPGGWQPTPVFLPGKFQEQRSLMGYSSWGQKESDTT